MNVRYGKNKLYTPEKVIAVGDVHGECLKLERLIAKITPELENPECHLVFCGDIVDQGYHTPKTLDFIKNLKLKYPEQIYIVRGNHEVMLERSLKGNNTWLYINQPTLNQFVEYWGLSDYKIETIRKEFETRGLNKLMDSLIPYYETEDIIITHAPIDRKIALMYGLNNYKELYPKDLDEELTFKHFLERIDYENLWTILNDEQEEVKEIDKFLICGHQFKDHNSGARVFKHRAFIDTGCGYKIERPVTALIYPGKKIIQEK